VPKADATVKVPTSNFVAVPYNGDPVAGAAKLTPRQRERIERVLDATIALAREGGYDAVKMRDVAGAAGVSLGTIYRYFISRDYLVYMAARKWTDELIVRALPSPDDGDLLELWSTHLQNVAKAYAREPRMLEAWVRATVSNDETVSRYIREHAEDVSGRHFAPMEEIEPEVLRDLRVAITQVWYAGVVRWAHGQKDLDDVLKDIERLVRLVLDRPATQ
jgi:AcrR family transcriptional regulator